MSMRMRRVYPLRRRAGRRRTPLTPRQEKAQTVRDTTEIRATMLCVGAALNLSKCSSDLTTFDRIRDLINTEVTEAVTCAAHAERDYNESFRHPLRPRAEKHKPKPKRAAKQ